MKIGIVSNSYFFGTDYKDGLKKLKSHGYNYYDFQDFISPDSYIYRLNDKDFVALLTGIKEESDKLNLKASQVHAVWYADDTSEEKREYNFKNYFVKDIIGCKLIGCKKLVVHPVMPFGWGKEEDYQKAIEINYDFWTQLLPIAKENDVTLCLENMPFIDHALNTPKTIADFIDKVNDNNFKMCFDTGHVNVFGLNIYENIVLCGDRIKVYHIHDNNWNMDVHLYPYQGCINWEDFIRANKEISFDGVYSLECCPPLTNVPKEVIGDCQKALANVIKYIAKRIEE